MPLPKLPKPPNPEEMFSVIDKVGDAIETGLNIIDKVADKFDQAAQKFGPPEPATPPTAPETAKEPPPGQDETSPHHRGRYLQGRRACCAREIICLLPPQLFPRG